MIMIVMILMMHLKRNWKMSHLWRLLGKFGLVFPKLTIITIYVNSNFQRKYPAKH